MADREVRISGGTVVGLIAEQPKATKETEIKAEKVEVAETPTKKPETKKTPKKDK